MSPNSLFVGQLEGTYMFLLTFEAPSFIRVKFRGVPTRIINYPHNAMNRLITDGAILTDGTLLSLFLGWPKPSSGRFGVYKWCPVKEGSENGYRGIAIFSPRYIMAVWVGKMATRHEAYEIWSTLPDEWLAEDYESRNSVVWDGYARAPMMMGYTLW